MPHGERDEILRLVAAAKARGVSLSQVWAEWSSRADHARQERSLGDAFADLMSAKRAAGRSRETLAALRVGVGGFVSGREAIPISAVTISMVESYLSTKQARSRYTYAARLSAFFEFARRRNWMAENPAKKVELARVAREQPAVFTPAQVVEALRWLREREPECLAWFVLSTFCGLRPMEAEKTRWEAISLDGAGLVRVEAQTSKLRARRVVYPLPSAMAWLKAAKDAGSKLPMPHWPRARVCVALARHLGLPRWPVDITRHTAASYWLAAARNPAEVAWQLGNSPDVLKAHYDARVTREESVAFWSITP